MSHQPSHSSKVKVVKFLVKICPINISEHKAKINVNVNVVLP